MATPQILSTGPLTLRQTEDGVLVVRHATELGREQLTLSDRNAALLAEGILKLQGVDAAVIEAVAQHIEAMG